MFMRVAVVCLIVCVSSPVAVYGDPITRDDVLKKFEASAKKSEGRVGVAALDLQSGEWVELNGDDSFPMQSVYKLPIAMAVLRQIDDGSLLLNQPVQVTVDDYVSTRQHSPIRDSHPHGVSLTVEQLLQAMAGESDGSACDVLLRISGGPRFTLDYLQAIGTTQVLVRNSEKELGKDQKLQFSNSATPRAMVGLLKALHDGDAVSSGSRKLLLKIMRDSPTGPRRLKGKLPENMIVAHKTGSSRTFDGVTAATNDVGIITLPDGRSIAIAVFVGDSRANDATRDEVIADIASAAIGYFSGR